MITVVLIIQLMICAALVAVILLQRSEGGALGMGGGGGGGFMSGRGAANLLTRTTTILGASFFIVSIMLTILFNRAPSEDSILQRARQDAPVTAPGSKPAEGQTPAAPGGNVLERLGTKPAPAKPAEPAPK